MPVRPLGTAAREAAEKKEEGFTITKVDDDNNEVDVTVNLWIENLPEDVKREYNKYV